MVKRALGSCFVALMLVVSGSVAYAEADPSEALRQLGKKAFAAKDYKKAAANFEKVYRLLMLQKKRDRNQWISVHWALARAYAKLGKCEKALRFIKGVPKDVTDRAARARKTRSALERTCHKALLHQAAKAFHCEKVRVHGRALKALKALGGAEKRLVAAARICARSIDTKTPRGRRAARQVQRALTALQAKELRTAVTAAYEAVRALRIPITVQLLAIVKGLGERCRLTSANANLHRGARVLQALDAFRGRVVGELKGWHWKATTRCLAHVANAWRGGGQCPKAMVALRRMKPDATRLAKQAKDPFLKGISAWFSSTWAYCEPRSADFLLDTDEKRLAHKQYLLAKAAEGKGKRAVAIRLYRQALIIADVPAIRWRLAAVVLVTQGCAPAMRILGGIPSKQISTRVRHRQAACAAVRGASKLPKSQHVRVVLVLEKVLRGIALRGVFAHVLAHLNRAKRLGAPPQWVAVQRLRLFALHRDCARFKADWARAPADFRAKRAGLKKKMSACFTPAKKPVARLRKPLIRPRKPVVRLRKPVARPPVKTIAKAPGVTLLAPPPPSASLKLPGWVLVGVGGTCLATAAYFVSTWLAAGADADAAAQAWNIGGADAAATGGPAAIDSLYDDVARKRTIALSVGAIGLAALTTGLVFVLLKRRAPVVGGERTITLKPVISPAHVGVLGRF